MVALTFETRDLPKRKLTTIFVADVVGFSRLTAENETETIRALTAFRAVVDEIIAGHEGRIFNTGGDSVLAEFASPVNAVRCAVEFQEAARAHEIGLPGGRPLCFRIGINMGDVIVRGSDLLGDAVNVAARLESLAESGGICISGATWDQVRGKLALGFVDLGDQLVKNIPRPVRAYHLRIDASPDSAAPSGAERARRSRRRLALAGAALAATALAVGLGWHSIGVKSGTGASSNTAGTAQLSPATEHAIGPATAMTDRNFWLNGRWVVALSKQPVTDVNFCSDFGPGCRSFQANSIRGDGEYQVGWGIGTSLDSVAEFNVKGQHVRAVLPSDSIMEVDLTSNGELSGQLVNPKGYSFLIRARKLAR